MPTESKKPGSIELIDTHCHIHDIAFSEKFQGKDPDSMVVDAAGIGVSTLICVGTDVQSSKQTASFCKGREGCYGAIALHPHEAAIMSEAEMTAGMHALEQIITVDSKTVAIGECGLDYFYHDDPKTHKKQKLLLRAHFILAQKFNLPMIFHIRNAVAAKDDPDTPHAFDEFFEIFDEHKGIRGVVHSFSATEYELTESVRRGLYIGLNGIMTFTKDQKQLDAAKVVPSERLVLETDAPFLTPTPFRGKMCEPKHVVHTAEFLSKLRGESLHELATQTTRNARQLFGI